MKIYSVYDSVAKVYQAPMFIDDDDVAIRAFRGSVKPGTMLYDFPEDYTLFCLGQFDERKGKLDPLEPPVLLISASKVKEESTIEV